MLKRSFDILVALTALLILFPFFVILSLCIFIDSRGGVFYKQLRVGKNGKEFYILKFRSMQQGSDVKGLLTIGSLDSRITRVGHFIRRYKIDEFPQLINVLQGNMSMVGPRPEVKKYVDLYNEQQKQVLTVMPGITDYASIQFRNENILLGKSKSPEQFYTQEIMPAKLALNLEYIKKQTLIADFKIILKTIFYIVQ
jgi:lipopolysaccharide/colanic/teichoic acid biosynthesis glycosyltransferase